MDMDLDRFCRDLPKIELHAHLNGSLSRSTMLQLQRYYADAGISDETNAFFDEFQIGAGDTRNLSEHAGLNSIYLSKILLVLDVIVNRTEISSGFFVKPNYSMDFTAESNVLSSNQLLQQSKVAQVLLYVSCFQVFNIAHALTSTPETLKLATTLTLQEFQEDGCCYIELRSTPRDTSHMTKRQYIDTIVQAMQKSSRSLSIISLLIVSINRSNSISEAEEIADLAIEYHKKFPNVVVGLELSGNPGCGKFENFVKVFSKTRTAGLKVTLHCGEISNPEEILQMIQFKPDRIGHGTCIHPKFGGTDDVWEALCKSGIPVEVCLTSNVNTKSAPDYSSHHFKYLYDANIPVILCTDDKGVFATSLSQEYRICLDTFLLDKTKIASLALNAIKYIFAEDKRKLLSEKVQNFIDKNCV